MSSLISSSRKYRISFSCLVYVIIVVSFRIVTMSWFHSRENSFRFLQWSVTTTRPLSNGTIEPVSSLKSIPRSEIVFVTGDSTVSDQTLGWSFLRLFLPPVRFSITVLGHLPPFSIPPRDNTRTENVIFSWRPLPNLKHTPPPGI